MQACQTYIVIPCTRLSLFPDYRLYDTDKYTKIEKIEKWNRRVDYGESNRIT